MAKAKAKKKIVVKAKTKTKVKAKAQVKKITKKAPAKTKSKAKPVIKTKAKAKPIAKAKAMVPKKTKLVDVSDFVTPLDDRMIVQASEGEKITPGGIIIPDTVSTVSGNRKGVVLSVGRGHRDPKGRVRPMDVKKGDQIVFPEFAGSKLIYQGQELIILRETDVMGVLD